MVRVIDHAESVLTDLAQNTVEEYAAKLSKAAGKAVGAASTIYNAVTSITETTKIPYLDAIVFKVANLAGVEFKGTGIDWVYYMMGRAYEFVELNKEYFYNSAWHSGLTFWEMDADLFGLKDSVKHYNKRIECLTKDYRYAITESMRMSLETNKSAFIETKVYDFKTYLNNYSDRLDDLLTRFKDYVTEPIGGSNAQFIAGS